MPKIVSSSMIEKIVELRDKERLSFKEIGEILNLSAETCSKYYKEFKGEKKLESLDNVEMATVKEFMEYAKEHGLSIVDIAQRIYEFEKAGISLREVSEGISVWKSLQEIFEGKGELSKIKKMIEDVKKFRGRIKDLQKLEEEIKKIEKRKEEIESEINREKERLEREKEEWEKLKSNIVCDMALSPKFVISLLITFREELKNILFFEPLLPSWVVTRLKKTKEMLEGIYNELKRNLVEKGVTQATHKA